MVTRSASHVSWKSSHIMTNQKRGSSQTPSARITTESLREALRLFAYLLPYKRKFVAALGCLFCSSLLGLAFPFFTGRLIDSAQRSLGAAPEGSAWPLATLSINTIALVLLLVLAVQALCTFLQTYWLAQVGERALADGVLGILCITQVVDSSADGLFLQPARRRTYQPTCCRPFADSKHPDCIYPSVPEAIRAGRRRHHSHCLYIRPLDVGHAILAAHSDGSSRGLRPGGAEHFARGPRQIGGHQRDRRGDAAGDRQREGFRQRRPRNNPLPQRHRCLCDNKVAGRLGPLSRSQFLALSYW